MKKFEGSCLCGQVKYSIEAEDEVKFFHCHCSRCRKATGTGHASNIIISKTKHVEWSKGAKNVNEFKVPEASRFRNVFCKSCGGSLPRFTKDGEVAVIPAGTLDHDIEAKPEARIFTNSKANWSCTHDDVSAFEEYPN